MKTSKKIIENSIYFDADWYYRQYPDVKMTGLTAIDHFLYLGARVGRDPSTRFSTKYYLENNPDVAASRMNPLVHFIQFGLAEGRSPLPYSVLEQTPVSAIDVVIPIHNALASVRRALTAFQTASDGFQLRFILVDDASETETSRWVAEFAESRANVVLKSLSTNVGYTKAANIGLRLSTARMVLLLNSDAIITSGALRQMHDCMREPGVGIVGPISNCASWQSVPHVHKDGEDFAFNSLPDGVDVEQAAQILCLSTRRMMIDVPLLNGFCLLISRPVLESIGYFDEASFPVGYGEESDYCMRASDSGFRLVVASHAYVYHEKSQSFGPDRRLQLNNDGMQALIGKHSRERVSSLTARMRVNIPLASIRKSYAESQDRWKDSIRQGVSLPTSILYLLRERATGGGVHSIVQEASEMRLLGCDAAIGVKPEDKKFFTDFYVDIPDISDLVVALSDHDVIRNPGRYQAVVATTYSSVRLLKSAMEFNPNIIPVYYIQDYEPLFFSPDSSQAAEARASYEALPNCLLVAKTAWVKDKVDSQHRTSVALVAPSIDTSIFYPSLQRTSEKVAMLAMVRPQTPLRGAERTMQLLRWASKNYGDRISISVFGCAEESPHFQALSRDFEYRNFGVLTRAEVARVMRQSDLFIDLSDYQAFGRTALEAMACGCTSIVPSNGGAVEYALHNVNAFVVDPSIAADAQARLKVLIDNPGLLTRMQGAALQTAAGYSLRQSALSFLDSIARHVERSGIPAVQDRRRGTSDLQASRSKSASPGADPAREALNDGTMSVGSIEAGPGESLSSSPAAKARQANPNNSRPVSVGDGSAAPTKQNEHRSLPATKKATTPKLPITALVITWDIGHNPLGRSYMLAEVLDRVCRNVVITGFQFPRYGNEVWEPVRDSKIPVVKLAGGSTQDLYRQVLTLSEKIKPDVVFACKPRLPSMLLGLMLKSKLKCPLIVDIDDHELSFFKDRSPFELETFYKLEKASLKDQIEPYSEKWTRLSNSLIDLADARLVSNVALEQEFGGLVVPHVRDETVFDPSLYDKTALRRLYGLSDDAVVVLFFGTPRPHKGINVLAKAVAGIDDRRYTLVIVGTSPDKSVIAGLDKLAPGRIVYIPNQPFAKIPEIMSLADLVCLPQEEGNLISNFQLPAKAIDAIAMGIPLLVTNTAPLMQLVNDGVAVEVQPATISSMLCELGGDPARLEKWRSDVRPRFLSRYSYDASSEMLRSLIVDVRNAKAGSTKLSEIRRFEAEFRRVIGFEAPAEKTAVGGVDVVLFWKQNDSSLYGRRHDMVVKYLASRPDIRRVLVLDAPISEFDLVKKRNSPAKGTQDRAVYVSTYSKAFGQLDAGKVTYDVFVIAPGVYSERGNDPGRKPLIEGYVPFLSKCFDKLGIDPSKSIFWIYPKNYLAPAVIDHFKPKHVVVDVVDDHRAWPGVSDAEKALLTGNYREILRKADTAFVNCVPMQESMQEFYPAIEVIPNGCDPTPALPIVTHPSYLKLKNDYRPIIGFVGNLEAKIDIELIEKIAKRFESCFILLIGSTHANPKAAELAQLPNVIMPGVVAYTEVATWVNLFRVGIIPHRRMAMTNNMNPLKSYVYIAAHKPVISTDVENLDRRNKFVKVAKDHAEFLALIDEALRSPPLPQSEWESYVQENSWEARLSPAVNCIIEHSFVDGVDGALLSRTQD